MLTNLQNFLGNFSFLILLLSMIFYWVGTVSFAPQKRENSPNSILSPSFSEGQINSSNLNLETVSTTKKKNTLRFANFFKLGYIGLLMANISLFLLLVLRWKESGHFPLSNLYESLMFLSWCFTTIFLVLEQTLFLWKRVPTLRPTLRYFSSEAEKKLTTSFPNSESKTRIDPSTQLGGFAPAVAASSLAPDFLLGSIIAPSALFTNAFASFSLPKEMQESSPLVPALQSNWLMMHVTVMILSYAALLIGSLLSIAFLIVVIGKDSDNLMLAQSSTGESNKENNLAPTLRYSQKKNFAGANKLQSISNLATTLDNLSYRILGIGFPFLTIGILSGAVWANEAWGSYWSWDPKETWALLTWLVFAIYLHTRLTKGWQGKKPAMIAAGGFVIVWMCYLGVNLLGEGLHSYGWFSNA